MEPEILTNDYINTPDQAQQQSALIKREATSTQSLGEQVLLFGYRTSKFVDELPNSFSYFFDAYKTPLVTIGLVVVALIALKLLLTVLATINAIPLLAPTFRLIGLGYTIWFTSRYLIAAANRQELGENLQNMKEYVVGKATPSH